MTAHPLSPPPLNNNINIDHVTNAKMVVVSMKEAPAPTAELDLAAQLPVPSHKGTATHFALPQAMLDLSLKCWIYQ